MNEYAFGDVDNYGNNCGSKNPVRLKDIFARQTQDSEQDNHEFADFDFVYSDADTLTNEIAELYSYTEHSEFQFNVKAFEDYMESMDLRPCWKLLSVSEKYKVIAHLLDQLDIVEKNVRLKCCRCFLYLLQGCWAECQSDIEQHTYTLENVLLLYKHGVFRSFLELFFAEAEVCSIAIQRKVSVNINDSTELRVIISVLYIFVEVIRNIRDEDSCEEHVLVKQELLTEINSPIDEELLPVRLFGMVTRFCSASAPHYPIKKILLLIWKLLLFTLGGSCELKLMKNRKRQVAGLPEFEEDTLEIVKTMRASTPPLTGVDGNDLCFSQKRNPRLLRRSLMKQSSLDESLVMDDEGVAIDDKEFDEQANSGTEDSAVMPGSDDADPSTSESSESDLSASENVFHFSNSNNQDKNDTGEVREKIKIDSDSSVPRPCPEEGESGDSETTDSSTPPAEDGAAFVLKDSTLPWKPKIRQKDLDTFFDQVRLKFVGFELPGDRETVIGLPQPIQEGISVLRKYVYVSLSDIQIEREDNISKYPFSQKEPEVEQNATEILYQAMLPSMQQNIIALLKVLLAAAPTSKTKTDSINIMADVLPEEMPITVLQSMKLGTDVNRHKEIIVKAVSAILLLLLKHFKLNHVYQFEFLSQYLVFANCIPLILKFFNQNISAYVSAKNAIPILDFPACVIGDQPELTSENLEIGDNLQSCWRNVFSCINLLRVLNKVTKWKHSRIMMLVVFKSAPILKRTLKVRHAMMQLYILKLLKMQTKYLGRLWRKANMKIISAIYQKVRHRLNDDWAYGNDIDARPWDFQAEECALRSAVDEFNNRRYFNQVEDNEWLPVDVDVTSVLAKHVELSDEFKKHYHVWLQQEVFSQSIRWDELLAVGYI